MIVRFRVGPHLRQSRHTARRDWKLEDAWRFTTMRKPNIRRPRARNPGPRTLPETFTSGYSACRGSWSAPPTAASPGSGCSPSTAPCSNAASSGWSPGSRSETTPALGVAAVMPVTAVRAPHTAGWVVHPATPLPAGHVLVMLQRVRTRCGDEIEEFALVRVRNTPCPESRTCDAGESDPHGIVASHRPVRCAATARPDDR